MSTDRPKRETMTIEEATVSNMWGDRRDCGSARTEGPSARNPKACYTDRKPETRMLYGTRVSAALNVCFRPKTVIRGVDLRSIEDTAVIELLRTRPERKVER